MRTALVTGATGFIGTHLVNRLKRDGYFVWGIDRTLPEFEKSQADNLEIRDLRLLLSEHDPIFTHGRWDEVYCLAAEMGGAQYIFTGHKDADIMRNSALINLNILEFCRLSKVGKVFFASSACIYPDFVQVNTDHCELHEEMAYPARPDSNYGWEKLFAERLYESYARNHGMDVRIGRLHNIFGSLCTWQHGREKAPAAICRKVAQAQDGGTIDIFGDGEQTRSFLHVDECVGGILRLMASDFTAPLNIGSDQMISINGLVSMVCDIANKDLTIRHVDGPLGVRARTSNNDLIRKTLGWAPSRSLRDGMEDLYGWIESEVMRNSAVARSDHGSADTKKPLSAMPGGA